MLFQTCEHNIAEFVSFLRNGTKPGHREHVANAFHYIYYCTGSLSSLSASSRSPKTTRGSAGSLDQKIPFASHHGYPPQSRVPLWIHSPQLQGYQLEVAF